jgi:hypothetical protein
MGKKRTHKWTMAAALVACVTVTGFSPVPAQAGAGSVRFTQSVAAIRSGPGIQIRPRFGPAGTEVAVQGRGFDPNLGWGCLWITITFTDANGITTPLVNLTRSFTFTTTVHIPSGAALGPGSFEAYELRYLSYLHRCIPTAPLQATATFTVTGEGRWWP